MAQIGGRGDSSALPLCCEVRPLAGGPSVPSVEDFQRILPGEWGRGIEGHLLLLRESPLGSDVKCIGLNNLGITRRYHSIKQVRQDDEAYSASPLSATVLSALNVFANPQNRPMKEVLL